MLRSVAGCPFVRPRSKRLARSSSRKAASAAGPGRLGARRRPPRAPRLALGGDPDAGADPWSDETGHGSMVARIVNAVAPRATIVSVKSGVSATGAMSSIRTQATMDYLAGLATEMGTSIIANNSWDIFGNKNLILPCGIFIIRTVRTLSEANLVQTVWSRGQQ